MLRHPIRLLLCILGWAHLSQCSFAESRDACFNSCQFSIGSVIFNDTNTPAQATTKWSKLCQNHLRITSLYLSARTYCPTKSLEQGLLDYNSTCQKQGFTLPPFTIVANYTHDHVEQVRKLELKEFGKRLVFDEVVIPSKALYERYLATTDAWIYEVSAHRLYGFTMIFFWAVVVAIGISTRLLGLITGLRQTEWQPLVANESGDAYGNRPIKSKSWHIINLPRTWVRRYITVPATFGYHCAQNVGWCTIPPRIHSLTIAAFIMINIVLCSISYRMFPGNLYWPETSTQFWRYFSDRTGIISFANFPLLWLFGMRNNALMWLTGWDFSSYNSFHRWVARVATVEAIIHSIGYTILVFESGGWNEFVRYFHIHRYWVAGEVATVALFVICVVSLYGMRRASYELFLSLHIWISAIVLISMYYHVEIFGGEYNICLYPCVAIWILDRIARGVRILMFNPRFWTSTTIPTYSSSADIVRLTVPNTNNVLPPAPGTFYYIYILNDLRFWENHPFTLAYSSPSHAAMTRIPSHTSDTPLVSNSRLPKPKSTPSLTFLIRPYSSFTSRLRKLALSSSSVRVLIEGPYGPSHALHTFHTVLFLVGGSGIAVPLSHLAALLSPSSEPGGANHSHVTSHIKIVWAVKEQAFLEDVIREDFRSVIDFATEDEDSESETMDRTSVQLDAYLTGSHGSNKLTRNELAVLDTEESEGLLDANQDTMSGTSRDVEVEDLLGAGAGADGFDLQIMHGRPHIQDAIEDAATSAKRRGRLAVVVCGPAQMADDARLAVVNCLAKGYADVEFFQKSFSW